MTLDGVAAGSFSLRNGITLIQTVERTTGPLRGTERHSSQSIGKHTGITSTGSWEGGFWDYACPPPPALPIKEQHISLDEIAVISCIHEFSALRI